MIENQNPNSIDDSQAEVNPYEIPDLIWGLIEEQFKTEYSVDITESFPNEVVSKPTIVVTVLRRTPGKEGSKLTGKGANYAKYIKTTPEGLVHEAYIQYQQMIIEYSIYAITTAEVKRIAWDLERAVLETVGILQQQIEGFQMHFDQQTADSSLFYRQQDELVKRTIRFSVLVPVKLVRLKKETRSIEVNTRMGRQPVINSSHIRETSEKAYKEISDTGYVSCISNVFLEKDNEWVQLKNGTDYYVRRNTNGSVYIEWNDDFGNVPSVGDEFRIDYELSIRIESKNIR